MPATRKRRTRECGKDGADEVDGLDGELDVGWPFIVVVLDFAATSSVSVLARTSE